MRQIINFVVALIVCILLWMTLGWQLTSVIVFDLGAHLEERWKVLMLIWSDAPMLLFAAAAGMLIVRMQPLLFGVTCALAATASVVLCTSSPVLMKSVYVAKWALFLGFAVVGSFLGWWILRLRNRRNSVIKIWQSLATLIITFGIITLWQWLYMSHFKDRLYDPLIEAVERDKSNEDFGQVSCEAAPSADSSVHQD